MLASATIGNPGELATRLTGLAFDEVVTDGAPSGEKLFALWNPPVIDEDTGARRSALTEASLLVSRAGPGRHPHDRVHPVAAGGRAAGRVRPT